MGLSVFPAPSTGPQIPTGLRPPKFTFSNSWSLTGGSGISSIIGGNVMAYNKTDNTLYLAGRGSSVLYKFNLSTKSLSTIIGGAQTTSNKDLVCAQDGTLYTVESGTNNVSIVFSTNGGTSWSQMTNNAVAQSTYFTGWLLLVDNGQIPGATGNFVFASAGGNIGNAEESGNAAFLNNSRLLSGGVYTNTSNNGHSGNFTWRGGRAYFPMRDGDDNPAKTELVVVYADPFGTTGTFSTYQQESASALRYGWLGLQRDTSGLYRAGIEYSSTRTPYWTGSVARAFDIQSGITKPTVIQERYVVGVNSASQTHPVLITHDYENNLNICQTTPLRTDADGARAMNSRWFSNPIYISATKKLYVAAIYYDSGVGNARMYEYDVETY